MAKFKYGKLGYAQVLMLPLLLSLASEVVRRRLWEAPMEGIMGTILCSTLLICLTTLYFMCQSRPVYLIDFSCSKPDEKHKCPNALFLSCSHATGVFTEESLHFQAKICERSGLGDDTYLPPAVTDTSPYPCMAEARMEAEKIMFNALDSLFLKTDIKPKDIDFLIVNCSLFNPTPSLSSMIVNHYKMRPNIKSFNLGGMGCSTGVISIDLAKHLLQVHRNSYALVMSTENITLNWYWGNDRSMLLCNCIFRMGGAAILLSNKRRDKRRAKYEIVQSVRTHKGADDKSYRCVYQQEDAQKKVGVALSKELMAVAGDALKTNITTLGPLVLPISEQLLFFASLVLRKLLHVKIKPYIPDFKLAFEHFCIHAGGRAVLDEIEKNLHLGEQHMEPSRMTLYRFGNTSSSSLWYELAYTEAKGRIKRGDRIWQIAFGSGFKCNSAVWRALRCVEPLEVDNPWFDCIDKFPVNIPTVRAF